MKTIFSLLAIATGFSVMTPAAVQAGSHSHSSTSSCGSCGGSIYRERIVIGRDRCGDLIFGWRAAPHRCQPPRQNYSHGHGDHGRHGDRHSNRGGNHGGGGHRGRH